MLEMDELNQLFVSNGILLGKENTRDFFKLLDADNSGSLSMAEFKEFLFNDKCKECKSFSIENEMRKLLYRIPYHNEKG